MSSPTSRRPLLAGVAALAAGIVVLAAQPASATTIHPANDNFASPTFLPAAADHIGASNSGATGEAGEPQHMPGNAPNHSIWFRWTAPSTGRVSFDTVGSEIDTVLAAYTGDSLSSLVAKAKNDDADAGTTASRITFAAAKGTTYRIAVDAVNRLDAPTTTQGRIKLQWAPNDDFAAAQVLPDPAATTTPIAHTRTAFAMTRGATHETGEPQHAGRPTEPSVWYSWTASKDGQADITTLANDFDTVLAVYTGSTVSGLTQVAANDDVPGGSGVNSEVKFAAKAGTTYRIALDGFNRASGSAIVRYSLI
jgi:hypothetical protein